MELHALDNSLNSPKKKRTLSLLGGLLEMWICDISLSRTDVRSKKLASRTRAMLSFPASNAAESFRVMTAAVDRRASCINSSASWKVAGVSSEPSSSSSTSLASESCPRFFALALLRFFSSNKATSAQATLARVILERCSRRRDW
jgi:hypothetical protein